jgi:hypothetical protein
MADTPGTARYRVIEHKGWSYVVGPDAGPWRYEWEAQEEADRLNGAIHKQTGERS